ncbi:heterokaryon incompatibility protein-domain-containing protein [Daedaleopsis nitida]|nr:heterokaryon incompatibility protein-domain-containing protein [Daedaleopsis nitida]
MQEDLGALYQTRGGAGLAAADARQADKSAKDKDGLTYDELERIKIYLEESDGSSEEKAAAAEAEKERTREAEAKFNEYKHHQYLKRWGLLLESSGRDEEWYIADPEVLPEHDPGYLCPMCRHIDFEVLFTQRGLPGNQQAGPTRIYLFGLGQVMSSTNCAFCRLLRRTIVDRAIFPDRRAEDFEGESFYLNVLDEGPDFALRLEIELTGDGTHNPRFIVQRLDGEPVPLKGRPVEPTADLPHLKELLHLCEETHPPLHPRITDALAFTSPTLRIVDVQTSCVVQVPTPCRYACLSYVWGGVEQPEYTTSTRQLFESPNGLLHPSIDLPQTIKDALQVTRELSIPYLWVDALCILQDDLADKSAVISQMGAIYGNAAITIVATTNTSPLAGIAGVSVPRSRPQIIEQVKGMTLAVAFHDSRTAHPELEGSTWNTRAWTFQEGLLSRCTAHFISSHTVFRCPHLTFNEDTVPVHDISYRPPPIPKRTRMEETPHDVWVHVWADPTQDRFPNKAFATDENTVVIYAVDNSQPDGTSPVPAPVYRVEELGQEIAGSIPRLEGETLWDIYRSAVASYSSRQMGLQSDAINAFAGVERLIAQGTNTTFWYGLPEFAFEQALLWQPREELARRTDGNKALFPSWTWAAWEGRGTYRGRGWSNAINFRPVSVVRWLAREEPDWYIQMFAATGERSDAEIQAFAEQVHAAELLLREVDQSAFLKLADRNEWEVHRNTARNTHFFTHAAYPEVRFDYPISLPHEPICVRPSGDALIMKARCVPVVFAETPHRTRVPEPFQHAYLQLGLHDEDRSANFRHPWQRVVYHQGYRAGFLELNVPVQPLLDEAAQTQGAPDDPPSLGTYSLVAVARGCLPDIAPPKGGWDLFWQLEPRVTQYNVCFNEEWRGTGPLDVPPPVVFDDDEGLLSNRPRNENGDPHWHEERFTDTTVYEVYHVLFLRKLEGKKHSERIGVGRINVNAFHHAKPEAKVVVLK